MRLLACYCFFTNFCSKKNSKTSLIRSNSPKQRTDSQDASSTSPPQAPDAAAKQLRAADSSSKIIPAKKKESPYDHLPSISPEPRSGVNEARNGVSELTAAISAGRTDRQPSASPPLSPAGSDGSRSPPQADRSDEFSNLDRIPRSSPTLQQRPDHAQNLRRESDGLGGLAARGSATVRGRRSPPTIPKPFKKSNTLSHGIGTRSSPALQQKRHSPPSVPQSIAENEGQIHQRRQQHQRSPSAGDLYKVPRSMMDSPAAANGRSNGVGVDTYDVPKAALESNLDSRGVGSTNGQGDDGLYKVPTSVLAPEESGLGTYDAPRPVVVGGGAHTPPEAEGMYNVPRSSSNGSSEGTYSTPRNVPAQEPGLESVYNVPRTSSPAAKDGYEWVDTTEPSHAATLKPSRSFESLHSQRVMRERAGTLPVSPPATSFGRPRCEYIDIDLEEQKQKATLFPAKNTPLPPLPQPVGPSVGARAVPEGVYAEISEDDIARNRQKKISAQGNQLPVATATDRNPGHDLYDTPPPARRAHTVSVTATAADMSSSDLEGMAKAQELAEEGYELCLPAMKHLKSLPVERVSSAKSVDSAYPPVSDASALMEKYKINIHDSTIRSRPFSESDVLDDAGSGDVSQFGTSIPLGSGDNTDEYVIVTGRDHQPKFGGVVSSQQLEEDQYEVMTSARVNRVGMGIGSYPTPGSGESCVPQPHVDQPNSLVGSSRRYHGEENASAGVDLDAMSPAEERFTDGGEPFTNHQERHRRQSSGMSSTSSGQDGGVAVENGEGAGQRHHSDAIPVDHKAAIVKVMEGSPLDRSNSTDLK